MIRDILKQIVPPGHQEHENLDCLLPKEWKTAEEQVLEVWFNMKTPQKSQLDVEKNNTEYITAITQNFNKSKQSLLGQEYK